MSPLSCWHKLESFHFYLNKIKELNSQISEEIQNVKKAKLQNRLDRLVENKSSVSNEIWNIRRKAIGNADLKLTIKSQEGEKLTEQEDIKARYLEYFCELLEPRPPATDYSQHAIEINKLFNINMQITSYDSLEINQPFDMEELEIVIKDLKRNKCPGPDEIPNEIIKYSGTAMKKSILNMINTFFMKEKIPTELLKLNIKSVFKGKGDTGDLANHRGLFIGNSILKLYETLKLNGIANDLKFSEYQAGGRKSHGIADQLFIIYSIIQKAKNDNTALILQFMDLIKAFDKMLLKAVMLDLWDSEIKGRLWRNIFQINKQAKIKIKTPFGETSEAEIAEILKQGSVLATILAALHTDSIKKYFVNSGLGSYYRNLHIPNLLFQDDIVRIEKNSNDMNTANMRHNTYKEINRMKFHEDKTVILRVNMKKPEQTEVKLDGKLLKCVKQQKYLGDIITENGTHEKTIMERENNITGTTAEISNILSETAHVIQMKSITQYMKNIIITKLTNNQH